MNGQTGFWLFFVGRTMTGTCVLSSLFPILAEPFESRRSPLCSLPEGAGIQILAPGEIDMCQMTVGHEHVHDQKALIRSMLDKTASMNL